MMYSLTSIGVYPVRSYVIFNLFHQGNEKGNLNVVAIPVDESGKVIEDDYVEDPYSLVGKNLIFTLKIASARDLPKKYKKTSCR